MFSKRRLKKITYGNCQVQKYSPFKKIIYACSKKSRVASLAETSQGLYFPSTKFQNSDLIQNIHAERLFHILLVLGDWIVYV